MRKKEKKSTAHIKEHKYIPCCCCWYSCSFTSCVVCYCQASTNSNSSNKKIYETRDFFSFQFEFNEKAWLTRVTEWMDECMYVWMCERYVCALLRICPGLSCCCCCCWNSFRFFFEFYFIFWPGWVFMLARAWLTRTSIILLDSTFFLFILFYFILFCFECV